MVMDSHTHTRTHTHTQDKPYFDHEKLDVYQHSIDFIVWSEELILGIERRVSAKDQLDRASTSIPLNIAEGNGKFSIKDRCRFLANAYGSSVECAACLDVLVAKKLVLPEDITPGKERLQVIVRMILGLMKSLQNRVGEEREEYVVDLE